MKNLLAILLIQMFSFTAMAASASVVNTNADSTLKSLSSLPDTQMSKFSNKSLFVFFQANCSACTQQIKDLKCLEKDFDIALLGSISTVPQLKKEYKKFKTKYPGYYADPITMAFLPIDVPATPQIIVWNKIKPKGYLGYKPCAEYKKLLLSKK